MEKALYNFYLRVGLGSGKENTCRDKKRITSEAYAKKTAKASTILYKKDMVYYPCVFCGFWHIGTRIPFQDMLPLEKKGKAIYDLYYQKKAQKAAGDNNV